LNRRNIPFVNNVKYLGVHFAQRNPWRLHIEVTEAKAFRTFITIYSVFRSERLRDSVKLNFRKGGIALGCHGSDTNSDAMAFICQKRR
jgi:hypothetical protein